jgi:hypothetical protein
MTTTDTTPAPSADAPRLVRHLDKSTGVPQARFTTHVLGERQIRTYTAMCRQAGRRPYELAGDLLLAAIRDAQRDPEVQEAIAELSAVLDADSDGPACRMCGCTENAACIGGCAWVPDPLMLGELCSTCEAFMGQAEEAEPQEVSEADAIGMLLDRLPRADAAELLRLAGSCPAAHIAGFAVQAADLLEGLRAELTAVVQAAHNEALAAQEWLAALENDNDALAELGAA